MNAKAIEKLIERLRRAYSSPDSKAIDVAGSRSSRLNFRTMPTLESMRPNVRPHWD